MKSKLIYSLVAIIGISIIFLSSSVFSQCLEEGQVMLPEPVLSNSDSYGQIMESFQDYFLTTSTNNDEFEFNGGKVELYMLNEGSWSKQAQLNPSEYNLQMYFGRKVAIDQNIIIIAGNTYTSSGLHFDELFIYTKDDTEEWTTQTETSRLILRNDLEDNTGLVVNEIVIRDDIVGISYYTFDEDNLVFYRINSDMTLSYIAQLDGPFNGNYENDGFGIDFDFNDEYIAVSASEIVGYMRQRFVNVYDKADVLSGTNPSRIAQLIPTNPEQQDFAIQVEIDDEYIYAANGYSYAVTGEYPTEVYVFKQPAGGWVDNNEDAVLETGNTAYAGYRSKLKVFGNYVFLKRDRDNDLYVFKKDIEWINSLPDLVLNKSPEYADDTRHFAGGFAITDNHLITNYQSDFNKYNDNNTEKLFSFYAPGGAFETCNEPHQEISHTYQSAVESNYGHNISYYANRMAVGAPNDNAAGKDIGAVYIYEQNTETEGYQLTQKITPPDGKKGDAFGFAVELSDSILFVSSLYYDSLNSDGSYYNGSIGKVYQYKLESNSWILQNTIYHPEMSSNSKIKNFGRSISYHDGYVAIGQYSTSSSESNGSVYLFKLISGDSWEFEAKMTSADQQGGDLFGQKVVLDKDLLIVGTGNVEYGLSDEMRVYIFEKEDSEWQTKTEDAYLIPTTKHRFDRFGFSIDLLNDLIIVGSPGYNYGDTKSFSGRAYLFKRPNNGWEGVINESLILEPESPVEEDFFGYSVHIDQNNILIGAASSINNPYSAWHHSDIDDLQPGKIYFFDPYSELDQETEVRNERYIQLSENNRYLDAFGFDLEGADDRVFVSAIYDNNVTGFRAGAVYELKYSTYIYRVKDPVCQNGEPFHLESNRLGGYWKGEGIADSLSGLFDPSQVDQYGWSLVTYVAGDCEVSSSIYIGKLPEIVDQSDSVSFLCQGEELDLFVDYETTISASLEWYHKTSAQDTYELYEVGSNTIKVNSTGFYKVNISVGLCQSVTEEFHVKEVDSDVSLSLNGEQEICSYDNKYLKLMQNMAIDSPSWFFKADNGEVFSLINEGDSTLLDKPGLYFARYTIGTCLFETDTLQVNINHLDIQFDDPGIICSDNPLQLKAYPSNGIWSGDNINSNGWVTIKNLNNGWHEATYKVQQNECVFDTIQSFEVLIVDPPEIVTSINKVCLGHSAEITLKNHNEEVNWFKSGTLEPIEIDDRLITDEPGLYYARFLHKGCPVTTDSIELEPSVDSLFVPNVITKNNDGLNEEFRIENDETTNLELIITNRWGDIIYKDNDENISWKAENVSTGVYYWQIQYMNCQREMNKMKGWVHVLK